MSSFKRKGSSKQTVSVLPGTRISGQILITSTGISSLDDLLGGGVPLSASVLYTAPDVHSSYGELIQKYFLAEGLAHGHRICLIADDARSFISEIMWLPKGARPQAVNNDSGDEDGSGGKVKIAWRYEKMGKFQTTVSEDSDSYCHLFELSSRVDDETIDLGVASGQVRLIDVEEQTLETILAAVDEFLQGDASVPARICIASLGSALWGGASAETLLRFLHLLRSRLRRHSHGCASISTAAHISSDHWGGAGWLQKLGWVADGALSLSAFSANPALASAFPSHHGLVQIQRLPSVATFVAPSDRLSTLRGLQHTGENNLAFRCTRKRLVFETLHLDIEGGTGERRTTAATTTTTGDIEDVVKKPAKKRVVFEDVF